MPDLLFWCDVESSGIRQLDGRPGYLMEFAWTITDPAGAQLTPLNSVFTALPTEPHQQPADPGDPESWPFPHYSEALPEIPEAAAVVDIGIYDGQPESAWWDSGSDYPSTFVRNMHDTSGLALEWARAYDQRPLSVIDTWPEMERLIVDDLLAVDWYDHPKASVQLAGAGVAHYEHTFLPVMAPRVFADPRFHYRTHDVSQILNGLATATGRTPGGIDGLIAAHLGDFETGDASWSMVEISDHRYAAEDWGVVPGKGFKGGTHDDRDGWARATDIPHRGAADVARALMAHRLLPRLTGDTGGW